MPIYEWACDTCGAQIDVHRSVADYRVPPEHDHPMQRVIGAAYAHGDITPYKALTGDMMGKEITGRKAHREFLKRNRLVEVGDQKPADTSKMRPTIQKGEIAQELKRAIHEHTVPDFKRGGLRERN